METNERKRGRRHPPRILVVEDDEDYRVMLRHRLAPVAAVRGWEILFMPGLAEGEIALRHAPIDLLVSDYHLTDGLGTVLTRAAQTNAANPHRVILSATPSRVESAWADEPDIVDEVWSKTWDPADIVAHIETRMEAIVGPWAVSP